MLGWSYDSFTLEDEKKNRECCAGMESNFRIVDVLFSMPFLLCASDQMEL